MLRAGLTFQEYFSSQTRRRKNRKHSSSTSSRRKSLSEEKRYKKSIGKAPASDMPPHYNRVRVQDLLNPETGPSVRSNNGRRGEGQKKVSSSATGASMLRSKIPCDVPNCKSQYASKDALTAHKRRSHAAPTAFVCKHCHSSFSTSPNLNKHIRSVHEKLKPFNCEKCRATFSFRDGLDRHKRMVHDQIRPFPCPLCSQRFKTKWHLLKHSDTIHASMQNYSSESKGAGSSSRH